MARKNIFETKYDLASERVEHIKTILNEYDEEKKEPTNRDLINMADYILYGKDEEGKSAVDKKEIIIMRGHAKATAKETLSLDALQESPVFNENQIVTSESIYKQEVPTINREKDADIPSMKELWDVIDSYQYKYDVSMGKYEDKNISIVQGKELQSLKMLLISLRTDQYVLKDIFKPILQLRKTKSYNSFREVEWDDVDSNYGIGPLGLLCGNKQSFYEPYNTKKENNFNLENKKFILDFTNPTHVYILLEEYLTLRGEAEDTNSDIKYIMDTLDFYIVKADLLESRRFILINKIMGKTNQQIKDDLFNKFNETYNVNYISTIWKKNICEKISEAAVKHKIEWDNRFNESKWKICSCCGRKLILGADEFVKNKRSPDGFSKNCKLCERAKREKKDYTEIITPNDWMKKIWDNFYNVSKN